MCLVFTNSVHIRQSNKWIKLDSRGKSKRTEQEYVDTILNGATHSMVDRINEIVQLIGSNQEVCELQLR